jgi:hypothetical protein
MRRYGHARKTSLSALRKRYLVGGRTYSSRALLKSADSIMDTMQSYSIKAGYRDASESARDAARAYASKALPRMKRIARAMKRSDDPGAVWTVDGSIKRLEKLTTYRFGEGS